MIASARGSQVARERVRAIVPADDLRARTWPDRASYDRRLGPEMSPWRTRPLAKIPGAMGLNGRRLRPIPEGPWLTSG